MGADARRYAADGMPTAMPSNANPSCRHQRTRYRNCSTAAP